MFRIIKENFLVILIGWIVMIAFDFLLHAGILAKLYTAESPFLLPAWDAFIRIPLGYLSFLLLGVLLVWLMVRLKINSKKDGALFGLKLGGLTWAAFALGLYSISTADPFLLAGWWAGQAIEMGIAGYFAGACFSGIKKKKVMAWVLLFLVGAVVITVLLQVLGFAPAMQMK